MTYPRKLITMLCMALTLLAPVQQSQGFGAFRMAPNGVAFDPMTLSPAVWLSDTGSDPSIWPDISGNARNASQGVGADQPSIVGSAINGRQIRRFSGGNKFMTLPTFLSGTTACTAVFVCRSAADPPAADANTGHPLCFNTGTGTHFPYTDGTIYDCFGTTVRKTCGNPTPSLASTRVISEHSSASDWRLNIDGSLFYSTSSNTVSWSSVLYLGKSENLYFYTGDLAEVLLFNRLLTTTERQSVERYLGAKWGVSIP